MQIDLSATPLYVGVRVDANPFAQQPTRSDQGFGTAGCHYPSRVPNRQSLTDESVQATSSHASQVEVAKIEYPNQPHCLTLSQRVFADWGFFDAIFSTQCHLHLRISKGNIYFKKRILKIKRIEKMKWTWTQNVKEFSKKKRTTPGIRWSSPTQLLIWRLGAYLRRI